jgi:hypothetical protein
MHTGIKNLGPCRRRLVWKNGILIEHIIDGIPQPIGNDNLDRLKPGQSLHHGLGDKIERIASPVGRAIDSIFGTKIAGCRGCKKMKARLNAGMPVGEALIKRIKGK